MGKVLFKVLLENMKMPFKCNCPLFLHEVTIRIECEVEFLSDLVQDEILIFFYWDQKLDTKEHEPK